MRFTDYKQKDLIGKLVVWTISNTVVNENTKIILSIVRAEKIGFQIENNSDKWFSYQGGYEKIVNGTGSRFNPISRCELITQEDADALKENFLKQKDKSALIDIIIANKKKLFNLDIDQLKQIADVVSGKINSSDLPSNFELKTIDKSTPIDNSEASDILSNIVTQIQSDHVQLIKNWREKLSLINAKLNNNGK